MTPKTSKTGPVDAKQIDRLVDGELDERERRAVLEALDSEPGGWRRCALAFIESQAFERALTSAGLTNASRQLPSFPGRSARRLPWSAIGGVAAAITVAFLAGFLSRGIPERTPGREFADPRSPITRQVPSVAQGTSVPAVRVPIDVTDDSARREAVGQPSALPEYVRRQLERQGYEVRGDRKLVSVALKDGRQVTVPVETFKYRYVGYQLH